MIWPNKIYLYHSLVLIGDFIPTRFQPAWFKDVGLLSKSDAESIEIKLIHPEVTDLEAVWFNLQVTKDRFSVKTKLESHHELVRDLVLGTFKLLDSFPLRQLGINFFGEFGPYEQERWHGFGDLLIPKDKWNEILTKPGMYNLQIKSLKETDEDGYIITTIKPSPSNTNSIYIDLNDHYQAKDFKNVTSSNEVMKLLNSNWSSSVENSLQTINKILSWI
jgi:hypothetical protein